MKINLKNTILALAAFAMVGGVTAAGVTLGQNDVVATHASYTATYTVASTSKVNASGAPSGTSASYSSTYTTKCQLTSGNSMTLTLSGYEGFNISGLKLSMKSNSSKGAGSLSVTIGGVSVASISDSKFNSSNWYGGWSTSYVDVSPAFTATDVGEDEDIVITIAATENSLYCESFALTYDSLAAPTIETIELSGITADEVVGNNGTLAYYALDSVGDEWTGDVTYGSTDPDVISIDGEGHWSALQAGTTTISVLAGEKDGHDVSDSLVVTVISADTPTLSLEYITDSGSLSVFTGQAFLVSATKTNLDSISYSVSGSGSVEATQDGDDYSGTFTGAGSVTITATGNDNTTTASLTFSVTASGVSSVVIKKGTSTYTSGSLQEDESLDLTASVSTVGTASTDVNWTSSAEGVATVSATGHVVGVSVGTATITATSVFDPTKSASCTITVKKDVFIPETNDVLTLALTGVSGTSYATWEDKQSNSDAIYAGKNAGGNSSIQLRSKESDSGIVTTASGGYAISVSLEWESHTTAGRVVDVYGKDTAYSSAADLYNSATRGTLIGSITYGSGLPTSLAITSPYQFIGLRSHDGALYLSSLTIGWGDHCEDADVVAVDQFIRNYMHLDVTGQGTMQCKNEGWFEDAKDHFAGNVDKAITGLTATQKDIILKSESTYKTISEKAWKYTDIRDRLVAWAEANQAVFNPETGVFSAASIGKWGSSENSVASLMVILVTVGVVATGGMILLSKKRKRA